MAISVDNVSQETFTAGRCTHKENRRKGQRKCPPCHAAYMREWRKTHPPSDEQRLRTNVRSYANTYKNRGKLIPRPCAICDGTNNIEMHHADYSKPLDVAWLCRSCHVKLHAGTLATKGVAAC